MLHYLIFLKLLSVFILSQFFICEPNPLSCFKLSKFGKYKLVNTLNRIMLKNL